MGHKSLISALQLLAILIAALGIVHTLALSVVERARELGLLRAVGKGRGAVGSWPRCGRPNAARLNILGAIATEWPSAGTRRAVGLGGATSGARGTDAGVQYAGQSSRTEDQPLCV